jgi:hypothetical protein
MEDNNILLKLEGESDKAFAAWEIYRDLGAKRNIRAVQKSLKLSCGAHIYAWRDKYKWAERIRTLEKIELETRMEAKKKAIEQREKSHLFEFQSYQKIISLSKLALHNKLIAKDEQGNLKYNIEELQSLSAQQLYNLVVDSSKAFINLVNAERNVLGLTSEIIESRFTQDKEDKERIGNLVANDEAVREKFEKLLIEIESKQNVDDILD